MPRRALCTASAACVVAGTFLPWRSVRGTSSDGWKTAHLALGLANVFGDKRLQLAALGFFLIPVCALGAWWFLLLVPSAAGILTARGLSALTLTAALATTIAAANQSSLHVAPEGPAVSVAAAAVLSLACWGWNFRDRSTPRTPGESS